jgi:hypothetical protein
MTTTSRFTGLAATQRGRTQQVNKAFRGIAEDLKNRKAVQTADCDEPQTVEQYKLLVARLRNQLADAQALIDEMRASANSEAPAAEVVTSAKLWSTERVAKESHVAICTICRNADLLGGIKIGKDWLFPAGTTYGRRRKRK